MDLGLKHRRAMVTGASRGLGRAIAAALAAKGADVVASARDASAQVRTKLAGNLCLAPGRIDTDRVSELDQARAKREGTTEEQARQTAIDTIPAGRYGAADEFAAMAAFLASPKAGYVTGRIIRIDGGLIRSV